MPCRQVPAILDELAPSGSELDLHSPADHAILEAEYSRNPKPDKVARAEIVERVALNDKEVQVSPAPVIVSIHQETIWFQNRRQVTRRKSRPLLPYEIYSNLHSSQESGEDNVSPSFISSSQEHLLSSQSSLSNTQAKPEVTISREDQSPYGDVSSTATRTHIIKPVDENTLQSQGEQRPQDSFVSSVVIDSEDAERTLCAGTESEPQPQKLEILESTDGANTALFTLDSQSTKMQQALVTLKSSSEAVPAKAVSSSRHLKRTSSSVRLSMSLDGKAQVVVEGNTPSPPRVAPMSTALSRRSMPLQRSMSAVEVSNQQYQDNAGGSPFWPRPSAPGRSRDARTWEFYCDSDARNALTVQAEQEQKGSALGVLSLIRSGSAKSNVLPGSLASNNNRRKKDPAKRKDHAVAHFQRPKMARTASSVARLQTVDQNVKNTKSKSAGKSSWTSTFPSLIKSSSGDSDKENWEPGVHPINSRRRREPQRNGGGVYRGVLQENSHVPSLSTSLGVLLDRENMSTPNRGARGKDGREIKENSEVDTDVPALIDEAIMPREEVDLDCVQNLLSLSQGAWR
ncbi:hypothetical protein MMC13_003040 [Lambiella insularis]|nr:hypothetical protein [Lambiella insularis]